MTTFGCSLAKHRKSATLFYIWLTSDIHRAQLAMIKKSVLAGETLNSRDSTGQVDGYPKSHLAKGPTSTTTKGREPT
ncbi:transcription initiation factor TFIID subunit 12-like [Coffea arabica]|uniref:Transcription initiation factor TFIID subunit 12-like n=1 Tax=Coffea arabica TaxID=13443 RepID=A0ABM4VFP6_COFAR